MTHFLADFALQTHEQAMQKSTDNLKLTEHATTYSLVWLIMSYAILGVWWKCIIFALWTFLAHYYTDYYTSRWVKQLKEKKDYHNMFVMIGADQIAHYVQLIICYKLLT